MTVDEFITYATAVFFVVGIATFAVIGVMHVIVKRHERHKAARLYIRLGKDASMTITGYPIREADRLAREWVADLTAPVLHIPEGDKK